MNVPPGSYTRDTLPPIGPGAKRILEELGLERAKALWPDRRQIACTLAADAEGIRRNQRWPPIGETELYTSLAGFGAKVGLAKSVEDCAEAYEELLLHLEHPEPGWD